MVIRINPHAIERMQERGATEKEIKETIKDGEMFPSKFNRIGYRRNFVYNNFWEKKKYSTKQIEAYTVKEENTFIVITVLVKYF